MIAAAMTGESQRALLRRGRKPLVGNVATHNTIAVSERDGAIVITQNAASRALLAGMGLVFGPGLVPLLFVKRHPLFILIVMIAVIVFATIALLRALFFPQRAVFEKVEDRQSRLSLSWPGQAGLLVLHVHVETDVQTADRQRTVVPNAVLVVSTAEGDVRVCASPDTKLIESLAQRVAALTQKSTAWQVKK